MIKNVTVILFLILGYTLNAQDYKFRKVSKEELKEKVYAKDSTAPAAYLYKKRSSYYRYNKGIGLFLITEVHKRIKIYNNKGFNFATETISLYQSNDGDEDVSAIKGYTYSLEGDKIIETKLGKDGIFKTKQSKNRNQVKFTLPNVKEGSIVEFSYEISSPFVQNIDEFVFQHSIPIKKLDAKMRILEYFKFNQRQKGFLPLLPKTKTFRDNSLGLIVAETAFELEDIPALKEEKYVSSIHNYRSGVKFEIVSLEIPGSTYKVYSKTWDDVVRTIYKSSSFGSELNKTNYFKEDLDAVLVGVTGEEERIKKVFEFVKQKVKWNTYRGYSSYEGTRKAYKEGTGSSADINLMLVAMLKYAKVKAHPVLVSTRDHGVPLFPTLEGYNYVIAAAKIGTEYQLLDATNSYCTMDILPTRSLNWYGRIVSENGNSEIIDLMPKKKSMDMIMMNVELNEDGSIDAKLGQRYTNNNAYLFRNLFNKGSEESFLEELEREQGDIEISDYELKNNFNLEKPIVQNYKLYKEDAVETISGKLYFSPMFHLSITENPFKSEKREFPVDYAFPWEDKYLINIKIPEGYQIESLPEPMALKLPDDMGFFRYIISTQGDSIRLSVLVGTDTAIIPENYYDALKEFYRQIIEKESERVVLSKT